MSWFSELLHPKSNVNQTQTYTPNPYAASAIQGAIGQAQNVAQTPFQTPVAPVAGFSGQQNQAFNLANSIPGAAMPYINEGANYLRGQGVENFYNPMAGNVIAGLKDIFGQQMSDTTGKLQQSAGGVGADRIAVGQSELAREQGLSAGQTLANLWQQALSASQNAGYGLANMGNLAQASQLQGMNALLTTGGLQQQLQQAQLNAPYQNELARIQWPYQNSQFLTGAVSALAPGLGGTTTGQTNYPQQSAAGTLAGLGMAGAGAYGLYNQNQQAARGGRIDGYAYGGPVIDASPIDVSERALIPTGQFQPIKAAMPQLQTQAPKAPGGGMPTAKDLLAAYGAGKGLYSMFGPGKASAAEAAGEAAPLGGASYEDFLAAENGAPAAGGFMDSLGAAGSGAWDALGTLGTGIGEAATGVLGAIPGWLAAALLPFGFKDGGRAPSNPYAYADGGAVDEDPGVEGLRRLREATDITRVIPPMFDWTNAFLGLRPGGVGMMARPNNRTFDLRVNGRFAPRGQDVTHPGTAAAGPIAALDAAAMFSDPFAARERMRQPAPERWEDLMPRAPEGPGAMAGREEPVAMPTSFAERWGDMPTDNPYEMHMGRMAPEPEDFGRTPFNQAPERVPLPRPKPRPVRRPIEEPPPRRSILRGHASGFEEGGEVDEFDAPLFLQSGMESVPAAPPRPRSPYEAKPLGGNRGALAADLESARYLRDNPGTTLSAMPSGVGSIVGAAIENQGPRGPQQIGAPRARPQRTWLPGVGDIFGMSAHAADAPHDPRPTEPVITPDEREAAEIQRINGLIAGERSKLEAATKLKVATDKNGKPLPTSEARRKAAIEAAQAGIAGYQADLDRLEGPQSPFGMRRAAAMSSYGNELERWKERQEKLAGTATRAQLPYAVKYPDRQELVQKYGPGVSGATGALMGSLGAIKGKHVLPALGAGVVGGLEGGFTSLWPTLQDAEFLPPGENNRSALRRLYELDPETWQRAGAGAMTHAPIAAGASLLTSKGSELAGHGVKATARGLGNLADWWRRAPAPNAATGNTMQVAAPAASKMRTEFTGPNGEIVRRYVNNGRTYWSGADGKRIKAPDVSKWKAGKPEAYDVGGVVEDRFGDWLPTNQAYGLKILDREDNQLPGFIPARDAPPPMPRANPWRQPDDLEINPYASGRQPVRALDNDEIPSGNPLGLSQRNANLPAPARQNLADSPWLALLNAGLGTMASAGQRDARGLPMPPLSAIGHGGQQGIKTLQEQRDAAMKQQQIAQQAKRLDADAARHLRAMAETERHNKENEARQREALDFQKSRLGVGLFDPETVNMMAEQALTGDKSVFANLGRGVSGPQNIVQVRQRMNEIAKERGYSGADIAAMNANFSAQTAAARTAAQREANIATAVEEAKGTFPLALAASGNLPRTDYTPINRLLASVRAGTSTPEQAEFALAHQAVITAYSQAMSRTGVNTVHAQERAEKAFSDVQNHESYERAIQQLEREMAVALTAPEKARQMILNRITGKNTEPHPEPTPMPTRGAANLPEEAVKQLKEGKQTHFNNGQVWTLRNGKPVRIK